MLTNRKGQTFGPLTLLVAMVIGLAVAVIVGSVIASTVQSVQDTQFTNTAGCNSTTKVDCNAAYNISGFGLTTLLQTFTLLPVLGPIAILIVIIGMVYLFYRGRQ